MTGITDLAKLLSSMAPKLYDEEYVFCTLTGQYGDFSTLEPISAFIEEEGLSLLIPMQKAKQADITFESSFKMITLSVHSSLEAVGLTAAVATKLTEYGISANVIAAYHHDHIMVQSDKANAAMAALAEFRQAE